MLLEHTEILAALGGFSVGILWMLARFSLLNKLKQICQHKVILPSIAILTLPFVFTKISTIKLSLTELAPIGTLLLVIIGFLNYTWNQRFNSDEKIMEQAVLALERAYAILTSDGIHISPPKPDRLNWLTSSRLLVRYEKLKSSLNTEVYKVICAEQEEHWRHKFYLLLDNNIVNVFSYFQNSSSHNLTPKSVLVIFHFAAWKKGTPDPLEEIDTKKYIDSLSESSYYFDGYKDYLSKHLESL